ncbi:unnamed protein product [Phytophthora lilii]|uniref:Unnamed protein product n=1 Tax=Phytophthora lilii TaxID=2077276 RepID=A0A9W6WM16_9STRA|nr:unnamed protein product [Phytophthora lilii]
MSPSSSSTGLKKKAAICLGENGWSSWIVATRLANMAELVELNPLLQSMDNIDGASDENDKKLVISSLETYSRLNPDASSSSVQLTLTRSIADIYLHKLQRPELAVTKYLEALQVLAFLPTRDEDSTDCLQVELLRSVVKCYKKSCKSHVAIVIVFLILLRYVDSQSEGSMPMLKHII